MTDPPCQARQIGNTLQAGRNGGGERDRTDDLLRARQALSQLSYTPWSRILTTVCRNTLNWWA